MKVKNVSAEKVDILGFGDVKAGQVIDIPDKIWKKIVTKDWSKSKPFRCERVECLVPLDAPSKKKASNPKVQSAKKEEIFTTKSVK